MHTAGARGIFLLMSKKSVARRHQQAATPRRTKHIVRPTVGLEPKRKISISLDAKVIENFETLAGESEVSLSAAMNEALATYLRERAMQALIDEGEPLTDEIRDEVRKELREAGIIP